MSTTVFLARFFGIFTIVFALAILVNRRGMVGAFESLVRDSAALLILELIGLAVGLAVVLSHNVWHGLLAIIVTLLGWIILLRAVILMLLRPASIERLLALVAWPQRAEIYAAAVLAFGLFLTLASFLA
jgi:hypothetical protein